MGHNRIVNLVAGFILAVCVGILLYAPSARAKNDFKIAQPEATPEPATPKPTYKPIKGVRITVQDTERQKEIEEKTKKKKKEIRAVKDVIRKGEARYRFYREVYNSMTDIQGIFDRCGTSIICLRSIDVLPSLLELADAEKTSVTEKKKELRSLEDGLAALERCRDTIVFNSCDITEISHITASQMKKLLSGTELEQFADVYVEIEKRYGINAIAFCALSALESRWGTSERARYDNNYTGFGVYSDDAPGINADSGEENLKMTAAHLAEKYIHKGGDVLPWQGAGWDEPFLRKKPHMGV